MEMSPNNAGCPKGTSLVPWSFVVWLDKETAFLIKP